MSIGRIGARAIVVGVGILVSSALAASPGWGARGSNEDTQLWVRLSGRAVCAGRQRIQDHDGVRALRQEGWPSRGRRHGCKPPVEGSFNETCTGFGLEPSTPTLILESRCGAAYSNGDATGQYGPQEENGTWAVSTSICAR
jgi:hypothetical protein